MERKKPEAGEKYRHFKGGIYEILHCAISTETREEMVVYVAVNRTKGKVFVSRLVNFMSPLIREQADEWGQKYRFEKIEEVAPICESEALQDDMTMILEFLDLEKNEEKLELNSKVGQKAFKHWYYTAQLNILTTVFNSYEYSGENEKKKIGNFMTPGYFTLSVGMDYKPNDNFSLYLSPIAGKWTYLRDTVGIDPGRYGVDAGKKSKGDAGARVELRNKFSLFKFIDVRNELIMFSSYYNSQQSFTGNWQVQLDFKINYFMRASVYTNVVYDENYSKKLQFKENLNLGVNFRF